MFWGYKLHGQWFINKICQFSPVKNLWQELQSLITNENVAFNNLYLNLLLKNWFFGKIVGKF